MSGKRTAKDLEKIKTVLLNRKQQLQEELNMLQEEGPSDEQSQDAADLATSSVLETLKTSLQNNELEEYRIIIKALEMLENGTYGECAECQQDISERRLMSYPNATRCLACQEIYESGAGNNF